MRLRLNPLLILLLLLVGTSPRLSHGDSREEAAAKLRPVLEKAAIATNLCVPGSLGFRMTGRVKSFARQGKPFEGRLLYVWESPSRWRQEIVWPDARTILVSDTARQWRKDVEPYRLEFYWMNRLLEVPRLLLLSPNEEIEKTKQTTVDSVPATCYDLGASTIREKTPIRPYAIRELCLDASNGLPLRKQIYTNGEIEEYSDYTALGLRRFPRRLRYRWTSKELMEIDVESLDLLENQDASTFAPPDGAQSKLWCANVVPPRPTAMASNFVTGVPYLPGTSKGNQKGLAVVGFVVDSQGHPRDVKVLHRDGVNDLLAAQLDRIRQTIYEPARCGETPLEYEAQAEVFNGWRIMRVP